MENMKTKISKTLALAFVLALVSACEENGGVSSPTSKFTPKTTTYQTQVDPNACTSTFISDYNNIVRIASNAKTVADVQNFKNSAVSFGKMYQGHSCKAILGSTNTETWIYVDSKVAEWVRLADNVLESQKTSTSASSTEILEHGSATDLLMDYFERDCEELLSLE